MNLNDSEPSEALSDVFLDDPSTGLTHLGAREYDPTLGRFISVDPLMDLADPQQMHGYTYSNNTPLTRSDPTGLRPICGMGEECGYEGAAWQTNPTKANQKATKTRAKRAKAQLASPVKINGRIRSTRMD